jgi:hypothetical protein
MSTIPLTAVNPDAHQQPNPHSGLNITFTDGDVSASGVWSIAGWTIQFVRLNAGQGVGLDQDAGKVFVKIITGALANPERGRFAGIKEPRDIEVATIQVIAGPDGALVAVMTATDLVPDNLHSMDALSVSGPFEDIFVFTRMDQTEIGRRYDFFNGLEAYLMPGFHLLESDGTEIVYVHLWTAGKGVDMSPHDHSGAPSATAPAFTETHFVLNNGTGHGAMYDCTDNTPSHRNRQHIEMARGQEHGPFWLTDEDGMPKKRENGSVLFELHGWQAGNDEVEGQAYDLVAAFELNPDYSKI